MKRILKTVLVAILILFVLLFVTYKYNQYSMKQVLFGIDKIVLTEDESKAINVEIEVNSEVRSIFNNAEYAGKFLISKGSHYYGTCYFQDGISFGISISKLYGVIKIYDGDNYIRYFTFKDGFDKVWLNYIESKSNSN